MQELKSAVSAQTKIKVIRAIESGIRQQIIAGTPGLSFETVMEIRAKTNAVAYSVALKCNSLSDSEMLKIKFTVSVLNFQHFTINQGLTLQRTTPFHGFIRCLS